MLATFDTENIRYSMRTDDLIHTHTIPDSITHTHAILFRQNNNPCKLYLTVGVSLKVSKI